MQLHWKYSGKLYLNKLKHTKTGKNKKKLNELKKIWNLARNILKT